MGISNVALTGHTGLNVARAGIATAGHNIANATTEGYSRQRVLSNAETSGGSTVGNNVIGTGASIARVERLNDEFVEKQIRNAQRDLSHHEEKDLALSQVEEIFNEMGGEGLNQMISKFFNEFRKLSEQPESSSLRNSLREVSQSMVNNFHRIRKEIEEVRTHMDSRIESYVGQVNALVTEISDLNQKIRGFETGGSCPNDFLDQRDRAVKNLGAFMDLTAYKDKYGSVIIDIKGVGPLVSSSSTEKLSAIKSPADGKGKADGALDLVSSGSANGIITHAIHGGRFGAILETRDDMLSGVLGRLDELAYGLTEAVNDVHFQGYTKEGTTNIFFFQPIGKERGAELISLSDSILENSDNISTGAQADAPGDNRIALAISKLQNQKIIGGTDSTADEWFNSIVADVGIGASHNRFTMNREKDVMTQLNKIREQISGVSIDEETTHLLEFQHAFDASAKVIQLADEMLKTILALKRD